MKADALALEGEISTLHRRSILRQRFLAQYCRSEFRAKSEPKNDRGICYVLERV